jgi:recombination associated protein RdgC
MFKNAIAYRITDTLDLTLLPTKLEQFKARNPGDAEFKTQGFTAPHNARPDALYANIPTVGHPIFIKLKTVERILPSAVVNDEVAAVVKELEEKENRKLGRKERQVIKDETILRLLPKAFIKSSYTEAFIDPRNKLIVVNAASFNKAEELLSLLRKALGSLPVTAIETKESFSIAMNRWVMLDSELPDNFEFEGRYALQNGVEASRKANFKAYDDINDIRSLIMNQGDSVTALSLTWDEGLRFMLDHELRVKGIKDNQSAGREPEDEDSFVADAMLTHRLLVGLFDALIAAFGGEVEN